MLKTIFTTLFLFLIINVYSFSPIEKYLRKAAIETEKGNLTSAKSWYLKALEKDANNYEANLSLGLMLCDFFENYSEALPYLEKALTYSKKDTVGDLIFELGKCYQYHGDFDKALVFYNKLNSIVSYEDNFEFQKDLKKRKLDCNYGTIHKNDTTNNRVIILNAGKTINSELPEYVPVMTTSDELIFTSKRKDSKKEELNYLDAKYYESMYVSKYSAGKFGEVRRYTVPDFYLKSKYKEGHESVISISPDGKKLFIYRNSKLFEVNMDDRPNKEPSRLDNSINFDYYQNHAYLCKDQQTLYFTSEGQGGFGANDIYVSRKNGNEWSKPENIGSAVNTEYDEDAPFLSDDGKTLYFASKGHPGYGNFDIYKSELVNNKWSTPQNLGNIINSPADDIYLSLLGDNTGGYFSSSRKGGFGDMDIYKVSYLDKINRTCPTESNSKFVFKVTDENKSDFKNTIVINYPENYKIIDYEWKVNENIIPNYSPSFEYDYQAEGTYKISSKIIAFCDTCLEPIIACNSYDNKFESAIASTATTTSNGSNPVNLDEINGELNNEQLTSLGFNISPILFDFDKSNLRPDAIAIMNNNIEVLKKYPNIKIDIIGYTDSRGRRIYNRNLSRRRSKSVENYLVNNKVNEDQIMSVKGRGDKTLVNECGKGVKCDEEQHALNRRVVFKVLKK